MKGVRGQRPEANNTRNLKHQIFNKMHLRDPNPLPPLKIFFADLHWSQEWPLELEKNMKSDNYLKIFIPDITGITTHCQLYGTICANRNASTLINLNLIYLSGKYP